MVFTSNNNNRRKKLKLLIIYDLQVNIDIISNDFNAFSVKSNL